MLRVVSCLFVLGERVVLVCVLHVMSVWCLLRVYCVGLCPPRCVLRVVCVVCVV